MKIAVFAGSFDPFTLAHQDLVERALPLFDKIIIAIGVNHTKKGLMSLDSREAAINVLFKTQENIEVKSFQGLTVNFCREMGAGFMLRGLRNAKDFDYENAIAQNNLILAKEIETYFLMSRSGTAHISSTIVRDIWANQGDITAFVPEAVISFLEKQD